MDFIFKELIEKYLSQTITEAEKTELAKMFASPIHQAELAALIDEGFLNGKGNANIPEPDSENIYQQIIAATRELTKTHGKVVSIDRQRRITRWVAAAAIVILLSTGSYLIFFNRQGREIAKINTPTHNDIAPGHDGAILTLSDGKKIILDSAQNGSLTRQGNAEVIKTNGQVSYNSQGNVSQVVYNTMTTPRGRQYNLTLADGSKVWLNAASSVTFPTSFVGNERSVTITGEAYFEIAHNASKPFHVKNGNIDITVLGTHLNVNAYDDADALRVTLLEGSVRVSANSYQLTTNSIIIKPGQQAEFTGNSQLITRNNIDLEEVMSWKNGRFQFSDASIETIMKEVSRYYDADVVYQEKVPGQFVADISRDVPVSKLLRILELTNRVHFKIEGKKIIVMK